MKKNLFFIIISIFLFFSCTKKEVFSIYVGHNFHNLLWDYNEKYLYALKNFRVKNDKNVLFIGMGSSFSQRKLENSYTKGKLVSQLFSALNYNVVVIGNAALEIDSKNMADNLNLLNGRALSSNIYWKKGNTPTTLARYIVTKISKANFGIISVIVKDFEKVDKRFYVDDYKIEDPVYEINRNISKIKKQTDAVILVLEILNFSKESARNNLEKLFSLMTIKPEIIILSGTKDFKPFKFRNSWVIPVNFEKGIISKIEIGISNNLKIRSVSITPVEMEKLLGFPYDRSQDIEGIIRLKRNTEEYFNKKISYSSSNIEKEKEDSSPLGCLIANIIRNYIRCNVAFYDSSLLKKDIKKGDITIRDVYELMEEDDHLIHVKIKGDNLINFLDILSLRKISFAGVNYEDLSDGRRNIYVSSKLIKKEVLYRVIIPQSIIRNDVSILSLATEFSVLPHRTIDAVMWYFKTHRDISVVLNKKERK